ncbi:Fur family transcriptional regulator [Candidatus Palauibacter sp.]|uniref:Fur family transcriptional regulator n=1 Tax=Candidatus Palauibacter sp. TaxID=3101350 RepID=UPI003B01062D
MQRDTRQRRAIRDVFMSVARPLTPDEILEHGRRIVPSLGIATVYRNVKALVQEGWLSEVKLPGGGLRYELAGGPHHHHFLCRTCDQAFDVDLCPDEIEELAPEHFEVESHELVLFGRCEECV